MQRIAHATPIADLVRRELWASRGTSYRPLGAAISDLLATRQRPAPRPLLLVETPILEHGPLGLCERPLRGGVREHG
jgi:hypothetical protein